MTPGLHDTNAERIRAKLTRMSERGSGTAETGAWKRLPPGLFTMMVPSGTVREKSALFKKSADPLATPIPADNCHVKVRDSTLYRHKPPLTRRFVVYYCSAVYIGADLRTRPSARPPRLTVSVRQPETEHTVSVGKLQA